MHSEHKRPDPDRLLQEIADYVLSDAFEHPDALGTARLCLLDSLGCAPPGAPISRLYQVAWPDRPGRDLPWRIASAGYLITSLIQFAPLSTSER